MVSHDSSPPLSPLSPPPSFPPQGAQEILDRDNFDDVPMQAPASEKRVGHHERRGGDDEDEECAASGLHIGALTNSYLLRGSTVEVYRNVENGVADAGLSLAALSLDKTPIRASKAMLAQAESNMLMLTPDRPDKIFLMNIERGKVRAPPASLIA